MNSVCEFIVVNKLVELVNQTLYFSSSNKSVILVLHIFEYQSFAKASAPLSLDAAPVSVPPPCPVTCS